MNNYLNSVSRIIIKFLIIYQYYYKLKYLLFLLLFYNYFILYIDKKTSQVSPINASSRNLWVSGLSSSTRATDLKQIFSKYGKVIGAKVVTNARTPGARCYGYVTMSTSEDAAKCIQHLHRTELHGRVISVEKVDKIKENIPIS